MPVWISLPEFPWHCYNKEFVSALLSPIRKVLYLDTASTQKTRGSLSKVKVQIHLTKERPPHVWMDFDEEDITVGRWQEIQYENVPEYCKYCKHQIHMIHVCTVKRRDEEQKKRKEMEAKKKYKNKGEVKKKDHRESHLSEMQKKEENPRLLKNSTSWSGRTRQGSRRSMAHKKKKTIKESASQQIKATGPASPQMNKN